MAHMYICVVSGFVCAWLLLNNPAKLCPHLKMNQRDHHHQSTQGFPKFRAETVEHKHPTSPQQDQAACYHLARHLEAGDVQV